MEYCYRNPLYHWCHLELKRFFDIDDILNEKNTLVIWEKVNILLKKEEYSTRNLIKKMKIKALCTTDDPIDTLEYHKILSCDKEFKIKVLPTFRPDKAFTMEKNDYIEWIEKLLIKKLILLKN